MCRCARCTAFECGATMVHTRSYPLPPAAEAHGRSPCSRKRRHPPPDRHSNSSSRQAGTTIVASCARGSCPEHTALAQCDVSRLAGGRSSRLGAAGSRAAQRLEAAGGRYNDVRALTVRIVGLGEEDIADEQILPFTPHAVAVVSRVREEAERAGPEAIGTEHILRAVLRRRDSVAVRVLEDCAIHTRELADELRRARPDED